MEQLYKVFCTKFSTSGFEETNINKLCGRFKEDKRLSHYHFYRDKTKEINQFDDKHPPVVVSHCEMLNFIKLTNVKSEHIKLVKPEHCHYKSGDKVRIVNGEFSGVEGRVARISGQQRVVVEMEGVCMVATAYIPSAFLEDIDNTELL